MAKVQNGEEILPKVWTFERQTYGFAIASRSAKTSKFDVDICAFYQAEERTLSIPLV